MVVSRDFVNENEQQHHFLLQPTTTTTTTTTTTSSSSSSLALAELSLQRPVPVYYSRPFDP
jgi:hypothetical protein